MRSSRALLLICSLLVLSHLTTSTDHKVGAQDNGWDIGVELLSWAQGQQFNVGDTLTFNYQAYHDVLEVSEQNYETCSTNNAFSRYTGGSTTIDLTAPGSRYFICGVPRHCIAGMRLEINVLSSASASPPPSSPPPPPPTSDTTPPSAASSPPPPSAVYDSSPPPPTPTPNYSLQSPPIVSFSPPPSTTYSSQPPPSPQLPTPTHTTIPPTAAAAPPKTTKCDSLPRPFVAPAPAPKHDKRKKPHHRPGKSPKHVHGPEKAPAPAPNVYKLSMNYVQLTSAAPAKNLLFNLGVSALVTVLMLWMP